MSEAAPIGEDEVLALARLARLDLEPNEVARMTGELARILEYVRQLAELDLDGVPEADRGHLDQLELREDIEVESLPRELALREAPRVAEDGFSVPAFVDEG